MSQQYSQIVKKIITELESRDPCPSLSPTEDWNSELTIRIENYSLGELFDGFAVTDSEFGDCVRSGLLRVTFPSQTPSTTSITVSSQLGITNAIA
ncbi:TPA: hypothetical protein EYN09_20815, partial [Candidatus Poribacteria bacterium]|nr:hypothetical protein [Candidatus Poribacteria bacterium]